MPPHSAGLLLYRRRPHGLEVLLVHPGGPFWAHRDLGAWSIPKGEVAPHEDPLSAARREVAEELGVAVIGDVLPLRPITQRSGKVVLAWAVETDWDPARLRSNTVQVEWPRGSGRVQEVPEVDRAVWFPLPEAQQRILPSQVALLDQLEAVVGGTEPWKATAPKDSA